MRKSNGNFYKHVGRRDQRTCVVNLCVAARPGKTRARLHRDRKSDLDNFPLATDIHACLRVLHTRTSLESRRLLVSIKRPKPVLVHVRSDLRQEQLEPVAQVERFQVTAKQKAKVKTMSRNRKGPLFKEQRQLLRHRFWQPEPGTGESREILRVNHGIWK